jgi:hypothetical protein
MQLPEALLFCRQTEMAEKFFDIWFLIGVLPYFYHKMRSAQTPFGIRAIMKKFIYMCNEKHYVISRLL